MTSEINDQHIIRNVTAVVANFLLDHIPSSNPEVYIKPFLPERVRHQVSSPDDLMRSDLYCNLRVLIGNNRFLRDAGIVSDNTVIGCARIVLSYRNRIAHQNLGEIVSIEHSQLEYIAVNRLISLLPTRAELQELIEETRIYVGSALVFLSQEYFNSEIATNRKVEILIRENSAECIVNQEYNEEEIQTDVKLSISECKQLLRRLREQIQSEMPDMPKWRNILRESILDKIVEFKVDSKSAFQSAISKGQFEKTDHRQFVYLTQIGEILSRL